MDKTMGKPIESAGDGDREREMPTVDAEVVDKGGQPKAFESGEQMIELYRQFNRYIISERGYEIIPSQPNFCEWLADNYREVDRKTIYNSLNKYFPEIKKDYEEILAATISQGAMVGKYQPAMTIFALKNWCKWTDQQSLELTGKGGAPLQILFEVPRPELPAQDDPPQIIQNVHKQLE